MDTPFDAVLIIALLAWIFAALETIGMWRFWPWVYRFGPVVIDKQVTLSVSDAPGEIPRELASVRMKSRSSREVLFRAPMSLFSFRINTPLPVKGTLNIAKSESRFVARLPVGALMFLGAWLVGWTVTSVGTKPGQDSYDAGFVWVGWLFVGLMVAFSVFVEVRRINAAKDQLLLHLQSGQGAIQQSVHPTAREMGS